MERRFEGKNVIVTGAGQGIGRAIAGRFAAEGATVMTIGRRQEPLERAVNEISAAGGTAWAHQADVSDASDVDGAVAAAVERMGAIDVLVNNAGIAEERPFLEIADRGWDAVIATNLRGAFLMAQRVARVQVGTGGGCIIHIASIDGSGGDGPYASYNASKAGLLGLNRTMALELGPHGVRVNCVSPGFTHTEMTEVGVPPGMMDYLSTSFDRVPLRRLVRPEEIAAACAFLASDDASAITGVDLTVDGGLTANWYILESIPDHA
jgi:meso-butanediol dehydrogenase / (S,S)-butanediol dehydrogenase / diacetyl reductase